VPQNNWHLSSLQSHLAKHSFWSLDVFAVIQTNIQKTVELESTLSTLHKMEPDFGLNCGFLVKGRSWKASSSYSKLVPIEWLWSSLKPYAGFTQREKLF
jgi:hypothetical protein